MPRVMSKSIVTNMLLMAYSVMSLLHGVSRSVEHGMSQRFSEQKKMHFHAMRVSRSQSRQLMAVESDFLSIKPGRVQLRIRNVFGLARPIILQNVIFSN